MTRFQKIAGLVLAFALTGSVFAQDNVPAYQEEGSSNDWHISLGLSYRDFQGPKFKSASAGSSEAAYFIGDGQSGLSSVQNITSKYSNLQSATIYKVVSSGGSGSSSGSYGMWESTGLQAGLEYVVYSEDSLSIAVAGNIQYFELDSASRHGNFSGSETTTPYGMVYGSVSPYPIGNSFSSSLLGGDAKTKMDLDLLVLDLGASLTYEFENSLSLSLAAGPSVTFADIDSATFAGGTYGGRVYSHDDDEEIEFGYYVSGGIAYWFTEQFGISAELRYDDAIGDIGTHYVTQDLDTWGGMLKFLIRF